MKDSMKKNILIKIKNLNNWLKNYAANFKASNYLKAYLGISFVLIIIFLLYLILDNYGILDKISSPEELQKIIQSKYHFVSALVYFAIQFFTSFSFAYTSYGYNGRRSFCIWKLV